MSTTESQLEQQFIEKLQGLKYKYRPDIRDRDALEGHFELQNEYVKVAEAAAILGVAQGTIRSWEEAGKIPMHKNPANGYRLFRRKDLLKFLNSIAVPAGTAKSRKG